jgi:hypothetical protein
VESPIRFGPNGRLLGIITRRAIDGTAARIGAVLPNVGAVHRVGPGRGTVSLARQLASVGVPSIRFDLSGLGDSDCGPEARENELYAPSARADTLEASRELRARCGVDRNIFVGTCSGAHAAYHAALKDPTAAGVVAVNLPTFDEDFRWPVGGPMGRVSAVVMKSNRFYERALLQRATWRRGLRGQVELRAVAKALALRGLRLAQARLEERLAALVGRPSESAPLRAVRRRCARGLRVRFVYGTDEPGLDQVDLHFGGRAAHLRDEPRFRLHVIDGADHSFALQSAQRRLAQVLFDLLRELEVEPGLAGPERTGSPRRQSHL